MTPRQIPLGLALAATLAATFWPAPEEESADATKVVGTVAKPRAGATPALREGEVGNKMATPMAADLFPAQTWQPPPPPAPATPKPVVLPPPPPQAPPLPFQYLGRWREDGKEIFFLDQGNRVVNARIGDALSGWHFDQADDTTLTFTWAALNQRQTLRIAP